MKNRDVCIGCGACVYVCPTGHIEMTSTGDNTKNLEAHLQNADLR